NASIQAKIQKGCICLTTSILSRIMELCHQFPHGITDQVIQNDMPHMEAQQRAMAINRLLSMGQLDLLRSSGGLLYRIKESQNAIKMKGSDNQEKLVYQIIEDAGDKGLMMSLAPSGCKWMQKLGRGMAVVRA
uniref:Uncharacterized protein n=1 Tax=Laticauda laticaudata TaxID=8630 RepID=A0A8C5RPF7_LATLA